MIPVYQMLVPPERYHIKAPHPMQADRIVVHNTANDASARNEIRYMIRNNNQISFHFAIDEKEVVQGIPLNRNAWHAGDGNGPGNRRGIAIEIAYSKSGGARFDQAEILASKFIAQLLTERNWGIDRVHKHQDYSNRRCPHRTIDRGWARFLNMIRNEMNYNGGVVYIVRSGDTLSAIARRYNTTWQELARINNLSNPNLIRVGQTIRINSSSTNVNPVPNNMVNTNNNSNPTNFRVGDRVQIRSNTRNYLTGQTIPNSRKNVTYTIHQVGTARFPNGILIREIMSWVNRADLVRI